MSNIDFDKRESTLQGEKSRKMDSLIISIDLFKETIEYMTRNAAKIKAANGYVFFKENDNNHNNIPYVRPRLRKKGFSRNLASSRAKSDIRLFGRNSIDTQTVSSLPTYHAQSPSLCNNSFCQVYQWQCGINLLVR